MKEKFPIIKAGFVFNKFPIKLKFNPNIKNKYMEINYPCRLDAMAINPAAVCYNDTMVFTPGEVVFSLNKFINVKIKVISKAGGILKISERTKRKVLVKHAYLLMCKALNVKPSLEIDVCDTDIPKHCGFGSSSSTIAAVSACINEIYGCPINNSDLIKYLASNHGEEISNEDGDNLKVVQCIGGGATNGLTDEGIIIIAGRATAIAKVKYESKVLVCFPNDFIQKDAKILMELEEKNLWKFKETGEKWAEKISYELLHKAIPQLLNGSLKELADLVFNYRFNMGSNENCSFVYDGLMNISDKIRKLYENKKCEFLALSSVGPAFFLLVNNEQEEECLQELKNMNMKVLKSSICNSKYKVVTRKEKNNFWKQKETNKAFRERKPSEYITKVIDTLDIKNKKCLDIGAGGGRYSRYMFDKGANVLAIDKYKEMFNDKINENINFVQAEMANLPILSNNYDLALSIGVIHNATNEEEFYKSITEIYRILKNDAVAIISIFTNDVITNDLKYIQNNLYAINDREPMLLHSKEEINEYIKKAGFKFIDIIDEHVTDVGGGNRYVYSVVLKK